ncbi:hypothetical protein AB5I41_18380 [Sphingomonas sp. MMS24-JH45]
METARVAQTLLIARPLTNKESGGPVGGAPSTELDLEPQPDGLGCRGGTTTCGPSPACSCRWWSKAAFFELGYLNQRQARLPTGTRNMNHAAVVGVSIRPFPAELRPPRWCRPCPPPASPPPVARRGTPGTGSGRDRERLCARA